jgi:hypothetical protein
MKGALAMALFAHHTKSYLGLEIDINDRPFPDGMVDHALALAVVVLLAYGAFALVRDLLRWRQKHWTRTANS